MQSNHAHELSNWLKRRLTLPLPGVPAQSRFVPEGSSGSHFVPCPVDARSAAVLVLFYFDQEQWKVPMILRPGHMKDHAGQVGFPGGTLGPCESPEDGAIRETEEEIGISYDSIELLGRLSPLYVSVSNFWVTPVVGTLLEQPSFRPNPDEVAEVLEIPLTWMADPTNLKFHTRRYDNIEYKVPHLDFDRHRIWGASGMIIGELIDLMRGSDARILNL